MAEQTTQKEWTAEEILAAAKEGLDSNAWKLVLTAPLTAPVLISLRAAIAAGEQILEYQKTVPDNYETNINDIKDKANYAPRGSHQVLCNENGSIALKDDGTISLASDTVNHLEMDSGGNLLVTNVDTSVKANSFSLESDDIVINNHKLNQKLYELADFKKVLNTYDGTPRIAGGLTMMGTVLVKAWETNLQRYVLVRRQVNMPVFSPSIGGPDVQPGLNITPDTEAIRKFKNSLNKSCISSYGDLMSGLQAARAAAVAEQEQATALKNQEMTEAAAIQSLTSMATLTGQDPVTFGASSIATGSSSYGGGGGSFAPSHGGGGGSFGVVENASQFADGYQWMDPTGINKDARNQCASFASQMMKKAGIDIDVVVNGDALASQFKRVGAYHSAGSGYTPQPGDLIDWAHHVGIYAGNGEYIARNSSGGVKRGSMAGMESYFGALWGFGSVAELQKAKGHKV